jgi:hypothetical protein
MVRKLSVMYLYVCVFVSVCTCAQKHVCPAIVTNVVTVRRGGIFPTNWLDNPSDYGMLRFVLPQMARVNIYVIIADSRMKLSPASFSKDYILVCS